MHKDGKVAQSVLVMLNQSFISREQLCLPQTGKDLRYISVIASKAQRQFAGAASWSAMPAVLSLLSA